MTKAATEAAVRELHQVPLTIDGSSLLHQFLRVRWAEWKQLPPERRTAIVQQAVGVLQPMESGQKGQSAVFSLLGHKGDLMLVHFRPGFEELKSAELQLAQLELWDFLEPTGSYLSVVELGLYESSIKLYRTLRERGVEPHSEEWNCEIEENLGRQREAMRARLFPELPGSRYLCFYPMDRKRGEDKNWYSLPIEERQRQMEEHGQVGRRYAGKVRQIISGSIGFDDWEWGVDLFADDPLVFKKLIYEMRFDEVSAEYALFGTFYVGLRCPAAQLGELLSGKLPNYQTER